MVDVSQVELLIEKLRNAAPKEQSSILDEYRAYIKSGLSAEAGVYALKAAIELGTQDDDKTLKENARSLIGKLADSRFPREHGVSVINYVIAQFPLLAKVGGTYTMWLLMNIPEPEGAQAVMEVVRRYFRDDIFPKYGFKSYN